MIPPKGTEHPDHTYAYNRRIRRLANANLDFNPNFGSRIAGDKSVAHLARIERRRNTRLRRKQLAEEMKKQMEHLRVTRTHQEEKA